ncbi:hypothetical protein [Pandoraea commovens]|uniref:Uncharacterized protein n=1 Tax=Pandoraea commovens TaxID=2508289 RepID=A0ABY5QB03_9BURK|nr:hypothetical protein [Pandoraea commovens]UVA77125.1 hypothetical protein NTU39_00275 [Pandoraea commovens]
MSAKIIAGATIFYRMLQCICVLGVAGFAWALFVRLKTASYDGAFPNDPGAGFMLLAAGFLLMMLCKLEARLGEHQRLAGKRQRR